MRIKVAGPVAGGTMRVQRGKDELLDPVSESKDELVFEFSITADIVNGSAPNFLGKYAQGPKDARFIYVNSGTYAGEHDSIWGRRAKLSLMSVTGKQIEEIVNSDGKILETSFPGTDSKGGPTCASVKGIEWKVVRK